MKSAVLIACVAVLVTLPFGVISDPKAEPIITYQQTYQSQYPSVGFGGNIGYDTGFAPGVGLGNAAGNIVGTAGNILGGAANVAGNIVGSAAGGILGAFNGLANGILAGALGNVVNSGIGGIITVEDTGRGCTAQQISGIIQSIFNDMKIYLQECRSDYDCRGISKERCGRLPELPNVGSVCLFS